MASCKVKTVLAGTVAHSLGREDKLAIQEKVIGIGHDGKILFVSDPHNLMKLTEQFGFPVEKVRHLNQREFLMPGMVDTHIHAPQYENCGRGVGVHLLEWLSKYTYPTECKFSETEYAAYMYPKVVGRLLKNGTTTASYYGTIHLQSCIILCHIAEALGQRAHVGKVCMDINSPDFYVETTRESLINTKRYVQHIFKNFKKDSLVTPVITPRFAVSCTPELMSGLAEIAKEYGIPIQTHMDEDKDEIEVVKKMHPECTDYASVYHGSRLLTDKTYLAHCIHMTDSEINLLKETGTGVSHCPNSNCTMRSGLANISKLLADKIKVGLGTDCSGGYSSSIMNSMRSALSTSNNLAIINGDSDYATLDFEDVFYMATLGGSEVLSLDHKVGNFQVGKEFDALIIDTAVEGSAYDMFPENSPREMVEKFILLGDDRNITDVFVAGRQVCHNGSLTNSISETALHMIPEEIVESKSKIPRGIQAARNPPAPLPDNHRSK